MLFVHLSSPHMFFLSRVRSQMLNALVGATVSLAQTASRPSPSAASPSAASAASVAAEQSVADVAAEAAARAKQDTLRALVAAAAKLRQPSADAGARGIIFQPAC
jgi:hypothetical protein